MIRRSDMRPFWSNRCSLSRSVVLHLTIFQADSYNRPSLAKGCDSPRKMAEFTHFNESGRARMVDVSAKGSTERVATAEGRVLMAPETLEKIQRGKIAKGDVLAVAQVAGIMGAKRTPDLIPMCHPVLLTSIDLAFKEEPQPDRDGRCSITVTRSEERRVGKECIEPCRSR